LLLVTNNGKVRIRFGDLCVLRFIEGGHEDVLKAVRDLIHTGHKLLTHPLAGSVKPNETPYRSVALTEETGPLDLESLQLIEDALAVVRSFRPRAGRGLEATPSMKEDFAEIDLRLIGGAIGPHLDYKKGE